MSVTNHQGSITKDFPPKLEIKAVCIRFSTQIILNTISSVGEELIKPSLIAACNEVVGQSAANKMEDIPLSNDTVQRWMADMAENTETRLIVQI
jgi:hypothetical protein